MNTQDINKNTAAPSVTIAPRNPARGVLLYVVTLTTHQDVRAYPCRTLEKATKLAANFIAGVTKPARRPARGRVGPPPGTRAGDFFCSRTRQPPAAGAARPRPARGALPFDPVLDSSAGLLAGQATSPATPHAVPSDGLFWSQAPSTDRRRTPVRTACSQAPRPDPPPCGFPS
jgi:hypothetical protein